MIKRGINSKLPSVGGKRKGKEEYIIFTLERDIEKDIYGCFLPSVHSLFL